MRKLRKEYRIRLLIATFFFISCGVVLGIFALVPAYIYSSFQVSDVKSRSEKIQISREVSGAVQIEKDLIAMQQIAERVTANSNDISYSQTIDRIVSHRTGQVQISSISIKSTAPGSYEAIIQGKAVTREALIAFRSGLEKDVNFFSVELPLSDLTKSKNVGFSIKLKLNSPNPPKK